MINDPDHWYRVGRGRYFEFRAEDGQVIDLLHEALPKHYAPYTLVMIELIKQGKVYVETARESQISDLPLLCSPKTWDFFVRSEILSPGVEFQHVESPSRFCSFNGMINLQHGQEHKGTRLRSTIGIVERVAKESSDEIVEHREYMEVFEALKRAFRPYLYKPS